MRFHTNLAVAAVNLIHILLTKNEVISYGMRKKMMKVGKFNDRNRPTYLLSKSLQQC